MTTPLRVIIADDEPDARAKLERLIAEDPATTVVGAAATGAAAVDAVRRLRPDVLFLDVRMPELDGFQVVDQLTSDADAPKIIFVTAFDEYAVQAFDVRAFDYILKPFDDERLAEALQRVRQQIAFEHRPSSATLRAMLAHLQSEGAVGEVTDAPAGYLDRVCIRSLGRTQFIQMAEVDWIEAYGNYVRLHTASAHPLLRQPLRRLIEQLDPSMFCRIHRSAVVNLRSVSEMRSLSTGDYIVQLNSGVRLKLSRLYRAEMDRRLGRKG